MLTIILPGYSAKNKDWAEEVKEKLDLDHKVVIHEWKHWSGGSFSLSKERLHILENIGITRVNIIAKSVGTRVLMHLIPDILQQLNKVILCGIPTKFESETPRKLYSKGLTLLSPSQVTVFQNEKDPLANYSVVEKFIHEVNPKIKVNNMPRSDHHYPYFEEFQNILSI